MRLLTNRRQPLERRPWARSFAAGPAVVVLILIAACSASVEQGAFPEACADGLRQACLCGDGTPSVRQCEDLAGGGLGYGPCLCGAEGAEGAGAGEGEGGGEGGGGGEGEGEGEGPRPADPCAGAPALLLHLDGQEGATQTGDASVHGHPVTFHGDAALRTVAARFGRSGVALDGQGDYLSIPFDPILAPRG